MSDYIMNRESLKRHCEAMCKKFKDVLTSGTYGEHKLVLDLLDQIEWIPVSDKLPNIKNQTEKYLVTLKNGTVCDAMFTEYEGDYWWDYNYNDVIAWMPLPEPYKAESEDK